MGVFFVCFWNWQSPKGGHLGFNWATCTNRPIRKVSNVGLRWVSPFTFEPGPTKLILCTWEFPKTNKEESKVKQQQLVRSAKLNPNDEKKTKLIRAKQCGVNGASRFFSIVALFLFSKISCNFLPFSSFYILYAQYWFFFLYFFLIDGFVLVVKSSDWTATMSNPKELVCRQSWGKIVQTRHKSVNATVWWIGRGQDADKCCQGEAAESDSRLY